MASKSIDDLLEKYKYKKLEIIAVTDFKIKTPPFYFKVIFKYTDSNGKNWYPVAEVPPEELHKRYKVGSIFYKKRQLGYSENISVTRIFIDNTIPLNIYKIRDVISNTDDNLITDQSMNEYFLKQNCYYISDTHYDVIIPHYTIANHFHFRSSSLKEAILSNTFNYLYFPDTFKRIDEDTVQLNIKGKANQSDLKAICNFIENKYSFQSFKHYIGQRAISKKELVQIEALFPYQDLFHIKTLSIQVNNGGKQKLLVLGIYQDDYEYPFRKINYLIDKSIDINSIGVDKVNFYGEKPSSNNKRVINTPPTSRYVTNYRTFIDNDFGDVDEITLNPIFSGQNVSNPSITKEIDKEVSSSFENTENNGDEDIQKTRGSTATTINKELDLFSLENYITLFESLKNNKEVIKAYISQRIELFPREDDRGKIPSKYYIEDYKLRGCLYGGFQLATHNIGFLEIQHTKSWTNISTWFFIFEDKSFTINEKFVNHIIYQYLNKKENLTTIEKKLKFKNIIFFRKSHPSDITSEKEVYDWIKRLLSVIVSKYDK